MLQIKTQVYYQYFLFYYYFHIALRADQKLNPIRQKSLPLWFVYATSHLPGIPVNDSFTDSPTL